MVLLVLQGDDDCGVSTKQTSRWNNDFQCTGRSDRTLCDLGSMWSRIAAILTMDEMRMK